MIKIFVVATKLAWLATEIGIIWLCNDSWIVHFVLHNIFVNDFLNSVNVNEDAITIVRLQREASYGLSGELPVMKWWKVAGWGKMYI